MTPPPFNGSFSGTTWVSWYKKGETNLNFTEATDSEWQWHQLNHMKVCISLQTDNHASAPPLVFYRPYALPAAQPTASALKAHENHIYHMKTKDKFFDDFLMGMPFRKYTGWVDASLLFPTVLSLIHTNSMSSAPVCYKLSKDTYQLKLVRNILYI